MLEKTDSARQLLYKAKASRGLMECIKASFRSPMQVNACKPQELQGNSGWESLTLEQALTSLERMPQPPSIENLTCILHKCRKKKNLAYAQRLHAYICKNGLETQSSIGNCLVPMLVEVGSLSNAQEVFNSIVGRNQYSWTSLITGYIECGEAQHALNLYQKMQDDCVNPCEHMFVALLKACARLKDVERGGEIHTEIARKGLERDIFVGNTLVDMYAKCGSLEKAREVFVKLPVRDVVTWNALIGGYAKHGLGEEALKHFKQMQLECIPPNAVTFACSLKACGSIGVINMGQEIHAKIASMQLERDIVIGNTLVDMYVKCGSLAKARESFDKLLVRDAVSWNVLISGYVKHRLGEEALKCFDQMQLEGIPLNAVTYTCSLKACGSIGVLEKGREIHAEISRKGLERDLVVGNTLVDMYAKCGLLAKAREVFDKLPVQGVVAWTALIAGYAECGLGQEALRCFEQMQLADICPNVVTFVCILKACGSIGAIDKGKAIHAKIVRMGLERDLVVGNTLVDMYAKCGLLAKAREAFDKLFVRDIVSWNTLITGYTRHGFGEEALNCFKRMQMEGLSPNVVTLVCILKACGNMRAVDKGQELHVEIAKKGLERDLAVGSTLVDMYAKCGLLAKAWEVFDKLPVRDVVSWTAIIAAYAEHGQGEEALDCFKQMQLEGVSPNAVTFVCSLQACGSIGAIDKGREIHAEIGRKGLERGLVVGNTLVDMYAKCGSLTRAQEVFDKLLIRDVISWNAVIAGYAHLGESENVFRMLERMREDGIKADGITFRSVLTVCSHTGLVDKGQKYFEAIRKDYGITSTIEHHNCMVDLLGRAGQLDKAVAMMKAMPFHPNLAVWHTVLGACRKWGNAELGRQAFQHAVQLNQEDAAVYVLMSNIYAEAHMQGDVEEVKAMKVNEQAWEKPGKSCWTDVGRILHSFMVGETIFVQS